MPETIYIVSWTQHFIQLFSGEQGERRRTEHVNSRELEALTNDPSVSDLRIISANHRCHGEPAPTLNREEGDVADESDRR